MNEFKQIQDVFGRFAGDSKIKVSLKFKSTRCDEINCIWDFDTQLQYLERLRWIRSLCAQSPFFASHELIGSSLLFVHDQNSASAWLIDFEKTRPVSDSIKHDRVWVSKLSCVFTRSCLSKPATLLSLSFIHIIYFALCCAGTRQSRRWLPDRT